MTSCAPDGVRPGSRRLGGRSVSVPGRARSGFRHLTARPVSAPGGAPLLATRVGRPGLPDRRTDRGRRDLPGFASRTPSSPHGTPVPSPPTALPGRHACRGARDE